MNNYTTSSKNLNPQMEDNNVILLQSVEPAFIPFKPTKKDRIKKGLKSIMTAVAPFAKLILKLAIIGAFVVGIFYLLGIIITPAVMTVLAIIFGFLLLGIVLEIVRFIIRIIFSLLIYGAIVAIIIALISHIF